MKSLKYLLVFSLPITTAIAFTSKGWLTFLPLFMFFCFVPVLELLFEPKKTNFSKEQEILEEQDKSYTYLLYVTVIVQLFVLGWFFIAIQEPNLSLLEKMGRIFSMGLLCGVLGINVGHELGHRNNRFDQFLGEVLLLTSLNTHFLPYHNGGHHRNVATPDDPATARKNEPLYLFWIRSHFTGYIKAWNLENNRMKNSGRSWLHYQNRMIIYTICNVIVLMSIYFFCNLRVLIAFIFAAIVGILLLQTVNYIEHYGLLRTQNEYGRYERVKRTHSWNSDHVLGRMALFNLSRHSDHHYNGSKHYQLLRSVPESPQLPTGYPGMMVLSLVPPLWFYLMNKRLPET